MTIRQIHDFGPAVGEYVCGMETDIRETFERVRGRDAQEKESMLLWIDESFALRA
jgi:hypothetical protein